MKFVHTSDWQMGMRAASIGLQGERVREARLEAARRVIRSAQEQGAEMLLVTGDVFEDNAVERTLVRKVGEILRSFPGPVYIIPGNHDPLCPGSVWEHSIWTESSNLTLLGSAEPLELASCVLFPCPLHEKYST
ncbi:MAG TPA: metallophosphoesterase, partial [Candidatus Saccharimonadales bacterium]|nr:metallophosphoesterase [Candidatus Saccharimonadales bacterium]